MMTGSIVQTVVWPVLVLILGYVSMLVSRLLLNANADIDKLPPAVKQLIVALISSVLSIAGTLVAPILHLTLPTSLGGFDSQTVLSILTAAAALILHNSVKITAATAPPSAPGH